MEINNPSKYLNGEEKKKTKEEKRSGAMHLFRVALYMTRRKRSSKSLHPSMWRRLMGSIRPLHASDITMTPRAKTAIMPPATADDHGDRRHDEEQSSQAAEEEEVSTPLASAVPSSSATSASSISPESRYASALNLNEMDQCDDSDDDGYDSEDGVYDDAGDEMIDVKAEEFIAKFYSQMRLQKQAYVHRYNATQV